MPSIGPTEMVLCLAPLFVSALLLFAILKIVSAIRGRRKTGDRPSVIEAEGQGAAPTSMDADGGPGCPAPQSLQPKETVAGSIESAGKPGGGIPRPRGRRVVLVLATVVVLVWLAVQLSGWFNAQVASQVSKMDGETRTAVDEFHSLYQAGEYLSIYEASHSSLQAGLSGDEALQRLTQARAKLGNMVDISLACVNVDSNSKRTIRRIEYRARFDNSEAWETFDWQIDGEGTRLLAYAVETGYEDGSPDWEVVLAPRGVRPNASTCTAE